MRLLVLDVEGTLFQTEIRLPGAFIDSTVWQGIAHTLGPGAVREEVETQKRWRSGGYRTYIDWMKETIAIHRRHGLTGELFRKIISAAKYNPGVESVLSQLDRNEYEPVLVSGGFRELAARAQRDLDVQHAFAACEYLFGDDDKIEAYNLLPCDFEGKVDFIRLMLREYDLGPDDWIFVGDGANDEPIARLAPVSVGYRAHPALKRVVDYQISEFDELLPITTHTTKEHATATSEAHD